MDGYQQKKTKCTLNKNTKDINIKYRSISTRSK